MWWWTARRGQMVEDLALWSSVHTDSALQSETLMVAVCWDWQQVFQMLSLIVWLEFSDMVLWLDLYRDMILLLISLIWCEYIWAVTALFLNLWWWIKRLHNHLYEYVFYVSVWVCMYVHKSVRACVCVCVCVCTCMHTQHIWFRVGVCLWERLWTLRRYCRIYPCTPSVLWVSLQCGAHCQIDRPLLKNPTLGRICAELMKPRSRHIKSNISTCLAVA